MSSRAYHLRDGFHGRSADRLHEADVGAVGSFEVTERLADRSM
jgi:hypothetical protein